MLEDQLLAIYWEERHTKKNIKGFEHLEGGEGAGPGGGVPGPGSTTVKKHLFHLCAFPKS